MTKSKYPSPEARKEAQSITAKIQMQRLWEDKRKETGKPLGYFGGHRRVRTQRGPVKNYKCDICNKPALHWAHIHDTSYDNPENYRPMCQSCHWKYDDVIARKNKTLTPEQRSALARKAWETKRKKLDVSFS